MDFFFDLYHRTPEWLHFIGNFFFSVIFIRGILANEILNELKERGILKGGLFHTIGRVFKGIFLNTERKLAIWEHYHNGHKTKSVLDCKNCVAFSK